MVICYGWTNTQLINLTNVRVNSFKKEEADLIILKLDRISEELVESIKKSGVFNRVFYIDLPSFNSRSLPVGKIPLLRTIAYGKACKIFYDRALKEYAGDTKYTKMLTAGYWAETIFLLRYFRRISPNITVSFVEEGINGYYADKEWLCKTIINGGLKEKIIRMLHFGLSERTYNKIVETIYLYEPQLRVDNKSLERCRMQPLNTANHVCYRILEDALNKLDLSQYKKRKLYYICNPNDNFQKSNEIITKIADIMGMEQIIIKVHPVITENDPEFGKVYEPKVFVDRRNYLFEGLYSQVNLSQKIIVTSGSSAVLNPKLMFNKEPFLIFTHRLYNSYKNGDSESDHCAADLKSQYNDRNKVMVARSLEELQIMLQKQGEY